MPETETKPQDTAIDELLPAATTEIEELQRTEPLTFVLVGKAGVGKSSTVNTLMGREVAKTSDEVVMTADVTKYEGEFDGVRLCVFDTPGLADGSRRDDFYLESIRQVAKPIDVLFYVRPMYETRLLLDEENTIRAVTATFGPQIWAQTVVVLTHADSYTDKAVAEHKANARAKETRLAIERAIAGTVGADGEAFDVATIPVVAFSNTELANPWGERFLTLLYTAVLERITKRGAALLLVATAKRLLAGATADSETPENPAGTASPNDKAIHQDAKLKETLVRLRVDLMSSTMLTATVALLGAALAGTASITVAVGAAIGAGVGALFSLFGWIGDKLRESAA